MPSYTAADSRIPSQQFQLHTVLEGVRWDRDQRRQDDHIIGTGGHNVRQRHIRKEEDALPLTGTRLHAEREECRWKGSEDDNGGGGKRSGAEMWNDQ